MEEISLAYDRLLRRPSKIATEPVIRAFWRFCPVAR